MNESLQEFHIRKLKLGLNSNKFSWSLVIAQLFPRQYGRSSHYKLEFYYLLAKCYKCHTVKRSNIMKMLIVISKVKSNETIFANIYVPKNESFYFIISLNSPFTFLVGWGIDTYACICDKVQIPYVCMHTVLMPCRRPLKTHPVAVMEGASPPRYGVTAAPCGSIHWTDKGKKERWHFNWRYLLWNINVQLAEMKHGRVVKLETG